MASKKRKKAPFEERARLILEGTWVTLAHTENIPEELWGHEACVIVAPFKHSDGDEHSPRPYRYQDEDAVFTVRTRDKYSATITATKADFATISYDGRHGLHHAG